MCIYWFVHGRLLTGIMTKYRDVIMTSSCLCDLVTFWYDLWPSLRSRYYDAIMTSSFLDSLLEWLWYHYDVISFYLVLWINTPLQVRFLNLLSECSDYMVHLLTNHVNNILNILGTLDLEIMYMMMICKIIPIILISIILFECNCFWCFLSCNQKYLMSQDLDFSRFMLSYMKTCAVALSVFIGVGGLGCPNALNMNLIVMFVCELWKSLPLSTSAANATTFVIVLHSISIGPFNFSEQVFFYGD